MVARVRRGWAVLVAAITWVMVAGVAMAQTSSSTSSATTAITAPDINSVAPVSASSAIAWVQNIAALAFAAGAAASAFFLIRLIIRMYGTDERGTPETMRQMFWFGAGFVLLSSASFWLGVLKGLTPGA